MSRRSARRAGPFSSAGSFDPDGSIVGYLWSFGDGSATSNLANPTHLYTAAGTYVAELTVTDGLGATKTAQVSVTVPVIPNQPPVAVGSATPNEGPAPLLVQFSSAGSHDPDGGVPATPWSWSQVRSSSTARCAEVTDNSTSNGAVVRDVTCESYSATGQGWRLDPGGLMISRIDAGDHGKCLDAGTGAVGQAVLSWDCHGGANQRWTLSGTQLVNAVAGLCLQSADAVGGPLRLTACNGSASQRWAMPPQ